MKHLVLVRGLCAMGQRQAQHIFRNVPLHSVCLTFLLITHDQYTCLQQNRLVQAALCSSVAVGSNFTVFLTQFQAIQIESTAGLCLASGGE